MHIVQLNASYKPAYVYGGPTISVSKLCEVLMPILKEKSHTLEVLTTTANGDQELTVKAGNKIIIKGVPVTYFSRITKDHSHFSPRLIMKLNSILRAASVSEKNTVIHIHAWWNLVSVLSCATARWYNIPVLLSPRGMLTAYSFTNRRNIFKKIIHLFLGKKLLEYCHVHATSEKEKEDILKIIKPKSLTVLPNLVDLSENSYPEEPVTSAFKLLFFSRIEQKKGLEILFQSLSLLNFDWTLDLAGTGRKKYLVTLKLMAEKLKIDDRITWTGPIEPGIKFNYLKKYDLLCLTSYNENFANVVLESLSVGTPVLISTEVGLIDYVKKNNAGWICELTASSIATNLKDAYENVALRKEIRQQGPVIVQRDYNPFIIANQYLSIYSGIENG